MLQHVSPTDNDRIANAPYNFVRLPETIAIPDDAPEYDQSMFTGLSGYIDLEFTTLSPLYVRGMLTEEQYKIFGEMNFADLNEDQKQEIAKFFEYNNTLTIPGSSLRGMFRTLVEVASYSKISEVTGKKMMYRSFDSTNHGVSYRQRFYDERINKRQNRRELTPKFEAGFLYKRGNNWYIQPSLQYGLTKTISFAKVEHNVLRAAKFDIDNGDPPQVRHIPIFFTPVAVQQGFVTQPRNGIPIWSEAMRLQGVRKAPFPGSLTGTLVISGPMGNKHSELVIFPKDNNAQEIEVPQELVELYKTDGVPYFESRDPLLGPEGVLQPNQETPVFFLRERGRLITFSHCALARIPYLNTPEDLIPGELKPRGLDLTQRLFGYVETINGKTASNAGRIFFEDATIIGESTQPDLVTPKVLSSPKPTSFQLYLVQTDSNDRRSLKNYNNNVNETHIRGHKFYWSQGKTPNFTAGARQEGDEVQQNMQTLIAPVAPGRQFKTRIRFENLTEVELGCMLWLTRLGAKPENCLRIGMGKPYGLGAVRITQKKTSIIIRDIRYIYKKMFGDDIIDLTPKVAQIDDAVSNKYEKRFSDWVISKIDNPQYHNFEDLPRIKELEILHRWNENQDNLAEFAYMNMEGDGFTYRKVLPKPIDVYQRYVDGPEEDDVKQVQEPVYQRPQLIVIIEDVNDPDVITCRSEHQDYMFDYMFIEKKHAHGRRFTAGQRVRCEILETEEDEDGKCHFLRPI